MAHILVIDDEPANRELLVTLFGYHGHSILAARDGAEGFTLALAEHPDLIITDILMPELDGYRWRLACAPILTLHTSRSYSTPRSTWVRRYVSLPPPPVLRTL